MLAKLLRWLIFFQVLLGAGLGYWLAATQQWHPASALLMAIVMPFVSMLLIDTVSALVSRAPGEPFIHWIRSVVGEFRAGIVVFIFRQPWSVKTPTVMPAITTGATRVPVVLVHGYMCNHRIWQDIAKALRAQGHAVFAVNLEPLFGSIDRYAPVVQAAVAALQAHTGQQKVALVGHSMGGLAIRAWMRAHGTAAVARVLTLGTPHAGTKLAKGATTTNGRQMLWQSAWLTELAAQETVATRNLIHIAITPQDNIVCPQRAQVLGGVAPVVFAGIGHVEMCLHRPVIQWVTEQLGALSVEKETTP